MKFICDSNDRHPNITKILKILNQPEYINITTAQAFINVYVYYWIWIKDLAQGAAPIYNIFKKNNIFEQRTEQTETMDLLRLVQTSLLALVFFDYNEGEDDIIFAINASFDGWEKMLMQVVKGKWYPSR